MFGVLWIELDPAAVAGQDTGKVAFSGCRSAGGVGHAGDERAVILGSATKNPRVALRDSGRIEHGGDHALRRGLPGDATILTARHAAIIAGVQHTS